MNIKIDTEGAFGSALITLETGEKFVSEAGAMYRASDNINIDVESRRKKDEGLWGAFKAGVKAMFGGESFFLSTYKSDGGQGEVGLAPTHQGEVRNVKVGPDVWICSGGSYLGSSGGINLDTEYQGLVKGMCPSAPPLPERFLYICQKGCIYMPLICLYARKYFVDMPERFYIIALMFLFICQK